MPAWWPDDIGVLDYRLDNASSEVVTYQVSSTRHDGTPVVVVGRVGSWQRVPQRIDGEWRELGGLNDPWRGKSCSADCLARAVVEGHELGIQLIGYESVADIIKAVNSLRCVDRV